MLDLTTHAVSVSFVFHQGNIPMHLAFNTVHWSNCCCAKLSDSIPLCRGPVTIFRAQLHWLQDL